MSSAAQLQANRRNAQHSTGPRTSAGKELWEQALFLIPYHDPHGQQRLGATKPPLCP